MVFSSLIFLCAFLPVVLALYAVCPGKYRNLLLTIASLLFYAWGEPRYVFIMLFSTVFDYINGRAIEYFGMQNNRMAKRGILILSIVGNLGILFFFKYTNLLITSWNQLTASEFGVLNLAMPIGISFYTFQTMSYTIDVYRGYVKAQKGLVAFAMYISMFPQLIAGPIVRYKWIEPQLEGRVVTEERWVKGAWIGAFAYTFQIYFDFSGYSDMAIGLGQMFGFTFPENFIYPYEAKNITDFWRRWHITLGAWFREYIYIPLGGNRRGLQRQLANLFVVWLLTGLWHGASWNFALWGIYFFVLLVAEKVFLLKEMEHWPQVMRHIYGKFFIVVGWVLFAIEDFDNMGYYLQVMFGIKNSLVNEAAGYYLQTYGILLVIMAVASTRIPIRLMNRLRRYLVREEPEFAVKKGKSVEFVLYSLYTFIILLISIGMLISGSYNPFLYFRF